ncbi:hypothetical protein HY408_01925 [Candidatus Gottesmanbacteria bacterium]|nr:hypothetical protein [Candidatus Gottesmanbacteria bacterium]
MRKSIYFLFIALLSYLLASPVLAQSPSPSVTPTPPSSTTPQATVSASTTPQQGEVLGETKVLGATGSFEEVIKWMVVGFVGLLVFIAGIKVARTHVEE